jgi:uncharacterized DUF497 family protein
MMRYDWDPDKNIEIQNKHEISFEEIVGLIARGGLLKTVFNPSPNYPAQKIMIIRKSKAIYMVPYEDRGETHWLITAFYSEKLTKKYPRKK